MDIQTIGPQAVDPFIQAYRDSLARARDAEIQQLNRERENQQAAIMSAANVSGQMYSNLPARTKIQYDVGTYNPNLVKIQSSYQTGLDTLRNKGVELANALRETQEGIDDYTYYTNLLSR